MKSAASEIKSEKRLSHLLFSKPKDLADRLKPVDSEEDPILSQPKAAWVDDDDEAFDSSKVPNAKSETLYSETLKRKYEVLVGTPSWALLNKKSKFSEDGEGEKLMRKVGHLQKKQSVHLKKNVLEFKKCPQFDLEGDRKPISCLEFHPTASVALLAGNSGNINLFSVAGDTNNKLHSFKLQNFIPSSASITPDGTEAYISSSLKHEFCLYNLMKAETKFVPLPRTIKKPSIFVMSPDGKYLAVSEGFEEVYLISTATKELIKILKHHMEVQSVVFSSDCQRMYSFCVEGEVSIWNLTTQRVEKKFYDHGCVSASCIATSPCGRLLATGSGEGIVNIYETCNLFSVKEPVPVKAVENLKTEITNLKFNASTEILSIVSSVYPNSAKLVHIPSYNVFSNFPPQFNLQNVKSFSFSPNSGFMALGNNRGCAYLFRLKHYRNY